MIKILVFAPNFIMAETSIKNYIKENKLWN